MKSIETLTERLRAQTERLQKTKEEVERLTRERYLALPALFGLASIDDLIAALMPYASSTVQQQGISGRVEKKYTGGAASAQKMSRKPGKPSRYPPELHEKIKEEMMAGGTVAQIAKKHGIPEPTLFMWRIRWGLATRARKKGSKGSNGASVQLEAIEPNKRYTVKQAAELLGLMEGTFRAWYAQPGNIEVQRDTLGDGRTRCYFSGSELIRARDRRNGTKTVEA
jgi:transposase-like protein